MSKTIAVSNKIRSTIIPKRVVNSTEVGCHQYEEDDMVSALDNVVVIQNVLSQQAA